MLIVDTQTNIRKVLKVKFFIICLEPGWRAFKFLIYNLWTGFTYKHFSIFSLHTHCIVNDLYLPHHLVSYNSSIPFPKSNKLAAVVNASFNKEIVEFSFCYCILIELFNDEYMSLLNAHKSSTGSTYKEDCCLYREDTSFLSGFEIDGLMFKVSG